MAKLFLYYLWVRLTERVHGVWLPSLSLAWEQARIANEYAAQQKMHPTLGESAASDSESKPAPKRVI